MVGDSAKKRCVIRRTPPKQSQLQHPAFSEVQQPLIQIIQVVPRLPPSIDGVGDYARLLAIELKYEHNIHTHFVVCDPDWNPRDQDRKRATQSENPPVNHIAAVMDGFPVHHLGQRDAGEMFRLLSKPRMPSTILLQFVGYGYHQRGYPIWLLLALKQWLKQSTLRTSNSPRQLATMFHELYASGPIWSSAFWTSPLQKWVAQSLATYGAHSFTNLAICAHALRRLASSSKSNVTALPVFSNVGEPELCPSWLERQPKMVVFGSPAWRRKIYLHYGNELEQACHSLGLNEIIDIGKPVAIPKMSVPVVALGALPSADVSKELTIARAGFIACPVNCLGKSGIFAAYSAHGLVPIMPRQPHVTNQDGLVLGKHFLIVGTTQLPSHEEEIGPNAYAWYRNHTLSKQAAVFSKVIKQAQIR